MPREPPMQSPAQPEPDAELDGQLEQVLTLILRRSSGPVQLGMVGSAINHVNDHQGDARYDVPALQRRLRDAGGLKAWLMGRSSVFTCMQQGNTPLVSFAGRSQAAVAASLPLPSRLVNTAKSWLQSQKGGSALSSALGAQLMHAHGFEAEACIRRFGGLKLWLMGMPQTFLLASVSNSQDYLVSIRAASLIPQKSSVPQAPPGQAPAKATAIAPGTAPAPVKPPAPETVAATPAVDASAASAELELLRQKLAHAKEELAAVQQAKIDAQHAAEEMTKAAEAALARQKAADAAARAAEARRNAAELPVPPWNHAEYQRTVKSIKEIEMVSLRHRTTPPAPPPPERTPLCSLVLTDPHTLDSRAPPAIPAAAGAAESLSV